MISKNSLILFSAGALVAGAASLPVAAQSEAETFNSSFAVPVFNSIDENGVDLVTGVWRVRTPTVSIGEGIEGQQRGLEWTGASWRHIGSPSLWRDGSKYIVQFNGQSHEFNGRSSNYSKRAPVDGSSLSCQIESPGKAINFCIFISRDGDVVFFRGVLSTLPGLLPDYGISTLRFGNLGISQINVSHAAKGNPSINVFSNTGGGVIANPNGTSVWGGDQYGQYVSFSGLADYFYDKRNYITRLVDSDLNIETPNHNDDNDEHYLRPRSTTQSVTDEFGNRWQYTFTDGGDRELTRVVRPGGLATLTAAYNSSEKVKSITTPAGTWNYSYGGSGDNRTTTVTNPQGETTFIRYNREYGYVTEVRDPLNRTTLYTWNSSTRRLDQIRYPEGNRTVFTYDGRGNVTRRTDYPKSGGGSLVWQAGGFPACTTSNRANCNKPRWTIDPKGYRTDFEYTGNIHAPTRIIKPAPTSGGPRPTIVNEYFGGRLSRTAICPSQAVCAGSSEEIVTEYTYKLLSAIGGNNQSADLIRTYYRVVESESITSGGETRTVCHKYDSKGRRISSTPPLANLSGCGDTSTVAAVAPNANAPENGPTKVTPSFPSVAGGGSSPGGGGGGGDPLDDPCLLPNSQVQCQ